ncbi:putative E3 ubiquitin-protein ligase RNF25 [Paratrimastix pyriformis]|uniref:E3 ubiquitin-protein ligase RNF25 n=1 Tax=Paratrimastix pyriformis TaxID=342808 RepID=A0ABQ8UEK6_9EUKA|nr:putative E3 ubiquitin-protein ligase RNF25 [Paratrimastix pyriformis]
MPKTGEQDGVAFVHLQLTISFSPETTLPVFELAQVRGLSAVKEALLITRLRERAAAVQHESDGVLYDLIELARDFVTAENTAPEGDCPICLCPLAERDSVVTPESLTKLSCAHVFHTSCLQEAYRSFGASLSCPTCRQPLEPTEVRTLESASPPPPSSAPADPTTEPLILVDPRERERLARILEHQRSVGGLIDPTKGPAIEVTGRNVARRQERQIYQPPGARQRPLPEAASRDSPATCTSANCTPCPTFFPPLDHYRRDLPPAPHEPKPQQQPESLPAPRDPAPARVEPTGATPDRLQPPGARPWRPEFWEGQRREAGRDRRGNRWRWVNNQAPPTQPSARGPAGAPRGPEDDERFFQAMRERRRAEAVLGEADTDQDSSRNPKASASEADFAARHGLPPPPGLVDDTDIPDLKDL